MNDRLGREHRPLLKPSVPDLGRSSTQGGPVRDLMEPGAERVTNPEGTRSFDQDEKRRLKRVVCVMRIGEHPLANSQDE